ncbi:glycerate kinase [Mycobacterium sp.]|uniref:glycerate kinase family protein n=1 Tax=Mycobacterium sp. TaxID=1785 RepID=UPI00126B11AD|nr:glycerate kinase [Mycobacterium sp.]KAA8969316.1 MAG: glycerate kinase [Mycobacterium sp.]
MNGAPAAGPGHESGLRVLIAPDCYGETLTAMQAAAAIATGWNRQRPADKFTIAPQSDGGPGFVAVLAERLGERRRLRVSGPLDDEVDAEWVFDAASATAYLGSAQACGLAALGGPPTPQTALAAHSRGVGQLLCAALQAGAARIVVGLGGSASTDGGRGLVDELGGLQTARQRLAGIDVVAACDVEYPLLGPWGAARIFGPQKGADPATVAMLEQRLSRWAVELDQAAGRAVSAEPGAGAAGGIGAALLALGGRYRPGAAIIAEHTGLADDIAAADLIVAGEGKFDAQSLHGKVVGALARAAREHHVPVLVLAGQVDLDDAALRSAGITAAYAIADYAGSVRLAVADAVNQLMGLASYVAAQLGNGDAGIPRWRGTLDSP